MQAQSALCLLVVSWIFTIVWVFAAEYQKSPRQISRAFLGLFWLPGLALYYLFPSKNLDAKEPTLYRKAHTPQTMVAPPWRASHTDEVATFDGEISAGRGASSQPRGHTAVTTDDGQAAHPTIKLTRPKQEPQIAIFELVWLNGPDKGRVWQSQGQREVHIGRHPNNHIEITKDPQVARWHAVLEVTTTGEVILRDADENAPHITEVNGHNTRTKVKQLNNGDRLRLGNTQLGFRYLEH